MLGVKNDFQHTLCLSPSCAKLKAELMFQVMSVSLSSYHANVPVASGLNSENNYIGSLQRAGKWNLEASDPTPVCSE